MVHAIPPTEDQLREILKLAKSDEVFWHELKMIETFYEDKSRNAQSDAPAPGAAFALLTQLLRDHDMNDPHLPIGMVLIHLRAQARAELGFN